MAIHVLEQYVSVEDYARLCNIERRSVLYRIKVGLILAIKVDGYYAVNIKSSPPKGFLHGSKPHNGGVINGYPDLRAVMPWAHAKHIRAEKPLKAIITGQIDGWVIGGEVFARESDLAAFHKK